MSDTFVFLTDKSDLSISFKFRYKKEKGRKKNNKKWMS